MPCAAILFSLIFSALFIGLSLGEWQGEQREYTDGHVLGLSAPRQLTVSRVEGYVNKTVASGTKVRVTWGLMADTWDALFGAEQMEQVDFNLSFNLKDPLTQRNIYKFCTKLHENLKVYQSWCWMIDFRECVVQVFDGEFPVLESEFNEYAEKCCADGSGIRGSLANCKGYLQSSARYLWIRDGKVKAMYATFMVDMEYDKADVTKVLDLKDKWDVYITNYNDESENGGALHFSMLWDYAESQVAISKNVTSEATNVSDVTNAISFLDLPFVSEATNASAPAPAAAAAATNDTASSPAAAPSTAATPAAAPSGTDASAAHRQGFGTCSSFAIFLFMSFLV